MPDARGGEKRASRDLQFIPCKWQDIADVRRVEQQHHQPVDTEGNPRGWGHAIVQRRQEPFVLRVDGQAATRALVGIAHQATTLFGSVDQLTKTVT